MGPFDLILHALGFVAPAFAVGALVALAARLVLPRQSAGSAWWGDAAINFIVGVGVLAAGLWYFGVDGKMASYAALVAAIASVQWARSKAWRG
ncbi:hypothetical protein [Caenimonas aquaedulcis]|uniref:Uncharacterized protein n=1 Tax=Caenimonas aquaedulcis TaxID=2793270 RepID=A0A931H7Y3_9BURK|nr:hypothetical protein [Caenimonas aquaedulcis]MBG9390000.1 hypothetical protein [Caenimonas aquaedulcis]